MSSQIKIKVIFSLSEKIKQAEEQLRQKHQLEREEERKRLDREAVQREIERKRKEMEEMQMKMKQEKVDAFKNTPVGKRAFADITDEVRARAVGGLSCLVYILACGIGSEEYGCRGDFFQAAEADREGKEG